MKKSKIGLVFLCIIFLMAALGCSSQTSNNSTGEKESQTAGMNAALEDDMQGTDSQSPNTVVNGSENKNGPSGNRVPGPGGENGQSALLGEVKSISGNKVTLALAAMPERGEAPAAPPRDRNEEEPPAGQPGERPAGQAPALELTGETQTITIPDGMKITSGTREDTMEIELSTIKAGDILQVFFKDGGSSDKVEGVRLVRTP